MTTISTAHQLKCTRNMRGVFSVKVSFYEEACFLNSSIFYFVLLLLLFFLSFFDFFFVGNFFLKHKLNEIMNRRKIAIILRKNEQKKTKKIVWTGITQYNHVCITVHLASFLFFFYLKLLFHYLFYIHMLSLWLLLS